MKIFTLFRKATYAVFWLLLCLWAGRLQAQSCPGNLLSNGSLENGTFAAATVNGVTTQMTTFGGSQSVFLPFTASGVWDHPITNFVANIGYWVDASTNGGTGAKDLNRLFVIPSNTGTNRCLWPTDGTGFIHTIGSCYRMCFWAAQFDPASPNNASLNSLVNFEILDQWGINLPATVSNFSITPTSTDVGSTYNISTFNLPASTNVKTTTGAVYTGATGQVVDWKTLNWQYICLDYTPLIANGRVEIYISTTTSAQNGVALDGFCASPNCGATCTPPTATAGVTQPTCTGTNAPNNGTITLAGFSANQRYQYSAGATFNSASAVPASSAVIPTGGVIVNTLPNTSGDYTVRIYDATDATCFIDRKVSITAVICCTPPTATASAANATCNGPTPNSDGTITLANFGTNQRYQYSTGTTFNSASAIPASITAIPLGGVIVNTLANTAQSYTVRIYDATDNNCYTDRTVAITTVTCSCPTLTAPVVADASRCGTGSISATLSTTCAAGSSLKIFSNPGLTVDETASFTITAGSITKGSLNATTTYYAACQSEAFPNCKSTGDTFILTITPPANAGTNGSISVCDNSAAVINLFNLITNEATGGVWTRTSGTGGTFSAQNGTFTPATGTTTSRFTYTVSGTAPCLDDTSTATVNISPKPTAAIAPKTVVICTGQPIPTFTATPAGGITYEWYGPLTDTTGSLGTALSSTTASLTPTSAQANYVGVRYFAVIVKNTGACADTAYAALKIGAKPTVSPASLTVCENTPGSRLGTFNLNSLNATVGGGNTVAWFTNKERTTTVNATSAYISTSGKAYAIVTNPDSDCSDTTSVTLTVNGKATQIQSETSCTATANGSGKIVVTATAPLGGTLEYKLGAAGTYSSTATFNGVTNGSHTIYVRGVGTSCYDSTIVTVNCACTQPTLTVTNPAPVCTPMTVNITAGNVITANTGIRTNYWKNSSLTQPLDATTGPATALKLNGTYYIKSMLADSTCFTVKSVEVVINPLPAVKDTSLVLCDLGSGKAMFNLTAINGTVNGKTNNTVSWFSNPGGTNAIPTPNAYLSGSGKVYVRVTNSATGCSDTTSVSLIIKEKPDAGADVAGTNAICTTVAATTLSATPTGGIWAPLGTNPSNATVTNTGQVSGLTAVGTYQFTYTLNGCIDTVAVETKNCAKGSLGNLVWKDRNDNGIQDLPLEKGVPGVIIQLLNGTSNAVLATDTTDTGGIYGFNGLESGSYKVKIVLTSLPDTCQISPKQDVSTGGGNDTNDSDFDPSTGESQPVNITATGTGIAKDNLTIDAALISSCVKSNITLTALPVCSADVQTYSVSFSVTNKIGTLKVNKGTLSGSNPYTVTGIPSGVSLKITDSLSAVCTFDTLITAPNCNCNPALPTLVTASLSACIGDTFPTLKATVVGLATVEWFSTMTGTTVLHTGLNFKPAGTVPAGGAFFYAQVRSTDASCPAAISTGRVMATINALDCTKEVDLALKKSISTKIARIGDVLTYTLKVWNESNTNATGVEVTDSIATTVQFVAGSFTSSRGSAVITGNVIQWAIGSIAANGDTVTLSYQVKATQEGIHFNTAEICKTNEKDVDSTPCNHDDDEDDIDHQCFTVPIALCPTNKVEASIPSKYINVKWFKDAGNTPIATGNVVLLSEQGTYTFTADNQTCPATGCCPVIIEAGTDCCPDQLCVPFTVKKIKK